MSGETALTINKIVWEEASDYGDRRQTTVVREGDCWVSTQSGKNERAWGSDLAGVGPMGLLGFEAEAMIARAAASAISNSKVVVVKDGGQYYVSPASTLVGLYGEALGALQPQDMSDLVRAVHGG